MKKYFFIFYAILIFFTNSLPASESLKNKEPKVLVLIIASDGNEAYLELQKIWRGYMRKDPDHFEVYFIRGNPDLPSPFKILENDIYVKTEEGYVPGILNKTILSIEAMLPRLNEFDYVLRTNLSSFYVFDRLLDFLKTLPKRYCYCGFQMHIPPPNERYPWINFISGAGILLSKDLAGRLVFEKDEFLNYPELPDDVALGLFFQNRSIQSIPAERIDFRNREDWFEKKDSISPKSFHFRAKSNYGFRSQKESFDDEIYIDQQLLKKFYP